MPNDIINSMGNMFNYLPGEVINSLRYKNGKIIHKLNSGTYGPEWSSNDNPDGDGFLLYIITRDHPILGTYMEMRQIYVRTTEREKGVATKLFDAMERIAKKENVGKIYIKAYFAPQGNQRENPFCKFLVNRKYKETPGQGWDWEHEV